MITVTQWTYIQSEHARFGIGKSPTADLINVTVDGDSALEVEPEEAEAIARALYTAAENMRAERTSR